MIHRGEIIKKNVYNSGYSVTKLAIDLKKSRGWVYQMFQYKNVSLDTILMIGEAIHYDFSNEIQELNFTYSKINSTKELDENNVESYFYWKNKYLHLLEDYKLLLTHEDHIFKSV
ncbi:hypothetical protein [uncultured Flavobacterium sp.]|uniref:hypothetical protein n=1 Tax=uncultured Flavobacterium sp. TaxID=165435 RepID=UPI0030CA58F9|tara:strand:+ start:73 stop:417 length:345 start_codon:yes stop_codon:yes gene_type:complete